MTNCNRRLLTDNSFAAADPPWHSFGLGAWSDFNPYVDELAGV